MGFLKKIWKDRVSEQPQRRILTNVDTNEETTVDVTRFEGMVVQEGDAFSAGNMNDLENRIKTAMDSTDATVNTVNTKANTNATNIASLQSAVNSISGRVTTNTNNISSLSTRMTNVEGKANTNASNISNLTSSKAPTNHASSNTTYGVGNANSYGHLKLSDSLNNSSAGESSGIAASSKAAHSLSQAIANGLNALEVKISRQLRAPQANVPFYFDYQNGKYGFNTDANRGADTFRPFKTVDGSLEIRVELHAETRFTEDDGYVDSYASSWANIYVNGEMVNTGSVTTKSSGTQQGHNENVDTKTYHLSDWNID